MEAKDVRPVEWHVPNGPMFHLYFVDEDQEKNFVEFGSIFEPIITILAEQFAGKTGTIAICILPDGSGGEIQEEHLEDVRNKIAQARNVQALQMRKVDHLIGMLASVLRGHGIGPSQENCSACQAGDCTIRRAPYQPDTSA